MKKSIFIILSVLAISLQGLMAQDAGKQLDDARSAYENGNLQETRMALQQAIHDLDLAIGREILALLPASLEGMQKNEEEDNVTSAGAMGLFVTRTYKASEEDKSISVEIIGDSPLMSGVNAILSLPIFPGDENQKRIRIGNRRALMQKSQDDTGITSWDVSLPLGSTLLTFKCHGIADEDAVTKMVSSLPIDDIARLTR
ncbi:MAG: hypothetical protein ACOCX0_05000 [Bacteroidota bacterium]